MLIWLILLLAIAAGILFGVVWASRTQPERREDSAWTGSSGDGGTSSAAGSDCGGSDSGGDCGGGDGGGGE